MRSLTPTEIHNANLADIARGEVAGNGALDPETDAVYVAVGRVENGVVEVDVIRIESPNGPIKVIGSLQAPGTSSEVVDLHYFSDDRSLVLILTGGDIATVSLEDLGQSEELDQPVEAEVMGTVDSGVKAAAWSPDEEQLILITGEDNVVCMTRTFDLIHEEPLRSEDFGEDKFVNVGWGSKSTQFHGSLGKAAARAPEQSSSSSRPASISHPTDDARPTISFRGDAAFFAVSSLDPYADSSYARRQIRIYSSPAGSPPKLSATSELLPGLEGMISWRPSGNLISGLVRYGYDGGAAGNKGRWEVAMMERNGLRHGGFLLREGLETWREGRVKGMQWNCDSEVLAIWIERKDDDVVQLWTMKNYHYYLKQELFSSNRSSRGFSGMFWHPEKALTLYLLGESTVCTRTFAWDTFASHLSMPNDTATVAVVDGARLLMTPFRRQNVPPPMSSYQLTLPSTPVHVSFSTSEDSVATLFSDGTIQVWNLNTRLPTPNQRAGKVAEPTLTWSAKANLEDGGWVPKQLCLGDNRVACVVQLGYDQPRSRVVWFENGKKLEASDFDADIERLVFSQEEGLLISDETGRLELGGKADDAPELRLPPHPIAMSVMAQIIIHLSKSGKLIAASTTTGSIHPLASGVTSFTHTPEYLIYATASQKSHYVPFTILKRMLLGEDVEEWERQWETRAIERGAVVVTACQSSMSLVLQMPRGNLETVYPRPLVLSVVRRKVTSGEYKDAFVICRKHRLDLNLLYDLDPKQFMDRLSDFVDQVAEVDYLNLFVSSLKDDTSSLDVFSDLARRPSSSKVIQDKLNTVCDAIRGVLEQRDLVKYTETILSTHVCKQPPDYEGGLSLLLQLQKSHPDIVEDAVKYIIFLSNVNQLYDVALGMYDFQLVLMVAQYSQKDPQEYLPFLKELRALEDWERKFKVDDHLERYSKALRHLHSAGSDKFQDAVDYVGKYELYNTAFELYSEDPASLAVIWEMYGDHLLDRRDYSDAALAYMLAEKPEKAMKAFERAHAWRDLMALAIEQKASAETMSGLVERCSDFLSSRGRHLEAAQLLLDHGQHVEGAVAVLCAGHDFSEALRIISLHKQPDLIEKRLHPGLAEAQESFLEAFDEMQEQLDKEMNRLDELRQVRADDPDGFYMVDQEPNLEGVDVATNATTVATAFTRYTAAPTTVHTQTSRRTGRTARNKNRASKKRAAGRKGSVDEYEYLIASIGRLITRVDEKSNDAIPLLRHLVLASSDLRSLASDLQNRIISFRQHLSLSTDVGWSDRRDILKEVQESGGMGYDEGKKLEEARNVVMPSVVKWSGVGKLA